MKKFLAVFLAFVLCCAIFMAPVSNADYTPEKPLILKFTYPGTATDIRGQAVAAMGEKIAERTGGAIKVEIYPGNELGTQNDTIEMISQGANIIQTISADFTCDYGNPDMLLCNVFFLFDSTEKTLQFSNSEIFKSMCDKVADGGIKILNLAWIEAPRQLMSTKPVKTITDLKGMKVRVPGFVYTDFWEGCGAVAATVGLADAYSALQTGILDATETNLESLYSYSIQEVCPYCTLTSHTTAPGAFLISEAIWETLSPEFQEIISEETYNAGLWFTEQSIEKSNEAKKLMEEAGVTFFELSDEDIAAMKEVVSKQVNSYIEKLHLTPGLYEEIVEFLSD